MSADGEGQEDGSSSSDLATWLAHWRLSSLLPALEEFGASHPIDLLDLEQEDVASLSMRKLELKRWGKGMEDLKEAILAAPQPPSPSLQILSSAVQKGRSPEAGDAQRDVGAEIITAAAAASSSSATPRQLFAEGDDLAPSAVSSAKDEVEEDDGEDAGDDDGDDKHDAHGDDNDDDRHFAKLFTDEEVARDEAAFIRDDGNTGDECEPLRDGATLDAMAMLAETQRGKTGVPEENGAVLVDIITGTPSTATEVPATANESNKAASQSLPLIACKVEDGAPSESSSNFKESQPSVDDEEGIQVGATSQPRSPSPPEGSDGAPFETPPHSDESRSPSSPAARNSKSIQSLNTDYPEGGTCTVGAKATEETLSPLEADVHDKDDGAGTHDRQHDEEGASATKNDDNSDAGDRGFSGSIGEVHASKEDACGVAKDHREHENTDANFEEGDECKSLESPSNSNDSGSPSSPAARNSKSIQNTSGPRKEVSEDRCSSAYPVGNVYNTDSFLLLSYPPRSPSPPFISIFLLLGTSAFLVDPSGAAMSTAQTHLLSTVVLSAVLSVKEKGAFLGLGETWSDRLFVLDRATLSCFPDAKSQSSPLWTATVLGAEEIPTAARRRANRFDVAIIDQDFSSGEANVNRRKEMKELQQLAPRGASLKSKSSSINGATVACLAASSETDRSTWVDAIEAAVAASLLDGGGADKKMNMNTDDDMKNEVQAAIIGTSVIGSPTRTEPSTDDNKDEVEAAIVATGEMDLPSLEKPSLDFDNPADNQQASFDAPNEGRRSSRDSNGGDNELIVPPRWPSDIRVPGTEVSSGDDFAEKGTPPDEQEQLVVLIISDDERLRQYGNSYCFNGRGDAFEFGAIGQVAAPLDGRGEIGALFIFQHLEMYDVADVKRAKLNTSQLLEQLRRRNQPSPPPPPPPQQQQQQQQDQQQNESELDRLFKQRKAKRINTIASPSQMQQPLSDDSISTSEEAAARLWKEALNQKDRKRKAKEEKDAAERAAEQKRLEEEQETAVRLEAEALNMSSSGGILGGKIPPATCRKAIPKGLVSQVPSKRIYFNGIAIIRNSHSSCITNGQAKQAFLEKQRKTPAEERAAEEAARQEAEALAEATRIAAAEEEERRREAEEAALPELQRKFLRRERERNEREEAERLAANSAEATASEGGDVERTAGGKSPTERSPNRPRKSSKIRNLLNRFQQPLTAEDPPPEAAPATAPAAIAMPGESLKDKDIEKVEMPTIFIISDDARLRSFGKVIEYNGRDAFEICAEGSIVAPLVYEKEADNTECGLFVFQHAETFRSQSAEDFAEAYANTSELFERLAVKAREASEEAAEPAPVMPAPPPLATETAPLPPPVPASASLPPISAHKQPHLISRQKKKGISTVTEALAAVAAGEALPNNTLDLSNQASFQINPDKKVSEMCDAMQSRTEGNSSLDALMDDGEEGSGNGMKVVKLKGCCIGDRGASLIAGAISAGTFKTVTELDLSDNVIKEDGCVCIARALARNRHLKILNLMGMPRLGQNEKVLRAFVEMYSTNFTLLKIVWRLDHPLANSLAQFTTRNNTFAGRQRRARASQDSVLNRIKPASSGSGASALDLAVTRIQENGGRPHKPAYRSSLSPSIAGFGAASPDIAIVQPADSPSPSPHKKKTPFDIGLRRSGGPTTSDVSCKPEPAASAQPEPSLSVRPTRTDRIKKVQQAFHLADSSQRMEMEHQQKQAPAPPPPAQRSEAAAFLETQKKKLADKKLARKQLLEKFASERNSPPVLAESKASSIVPFSSAMTGEKKPVCAAKKRKGGSGSGAKIAKSQQSAKSTGTRVGDMLDRVSSRPMTPMQAPFTAEKKYGEEAEIEQIQPRYPGYGDGSIDIDDGSASNSDILEGDIATIFLISDDPRLKAFGVRSTKKTRPP
jgi:hypothetical protein